jgi:hypothetical protein
VRAESPGKGRGSTFTLTLPLQAPGTKAEGLDAKRDEANRSARQAALQGVRVLVVDDDVDALDMGPRSISARRNRSIRCR